ncbi:MAG: DUF192 domain-containing protein [Deltaproteobacteria bacterium]|nr:DUF192 domain-containing protein [Deltaproteobacteria bacterium]
MKPIPIRPLSPYRTVSSIVILTALTMALVATVGGCRKKPRRPGTIVSGPANEFVTVTFHPPGQAAVSVRTELAATEATRTHGLMYRGELDPNAGMLFAFPKQEMLVFWMKNTIIPLDMIFIDAHKVVVGVVHDAHPLSTKTLSPGKTSQYVVEVNAGFSRKHHIEAGTKVDFTLPAQTVEDLKNKASEK